MEKISPKIVKDIQKSRFRDFCQFLEGFSFGEFGLGKKSLSFGFVKFGLEKKVSVLEILVSEKSLDFSFGEFGLGKSFGFGKFGLGKIVTVLVLENLVSKKKKSK